MLYENATHSHSRISNFAEDRLQSLEILSAIATIQVLSWFT